MARLQIGDVVYINQVFTSPFILKASLVSKFTSKINGKFVVKWVVRINDNDNIDYLMFDESVMTTDDTEYVKQSELAEIKRKIRDLSVLAHKLESEGKYGKY
jgi:hypothetical protein